MTGWLHSRIYDFWIGLKPSRFGLLTVLLLGLLLMEPWTHQGQDVLLDYAGSDFSGSDLLRRLWLYLATFCLAILTHLFCRLSTRLRFAGEKDVMRRYRQDFPRPPLVWTDPPQEEAITDAEARVDNILRTRKWAPRILGILIPLVVALSFLLAAGFAAWRDELISVALAVFVGLLIIPRRIQTWLANRRPRLSRMLRVGDAKDTVTTWSEIERLATALLCIVSVIVIFSIVFAAIWPLKFGQTFGPVPVIMLALTVILGVGSLLAITTRDSNFPWFFALAFVIAVLSVFDRHTMRFADDPVAKRINPGKLVDQFARTLQKSRPTPAILVATAGGGSRAAYWTATVLGELNKQIPDFNEHLLLISGVSGGSLGALLYRAATLATDDPEKAVAIAQTAAAGDFLSPLLSAMFTSDLISNLIPGLPDRAEVIEQAWSTSFAKACSDELNKPCPVDLEQAFLKLWPQERPPWPALILNGTIVETGGRAVVSNLDLHCDEGNTTATCGLVDVTDLLAYPKPPRPDLRASAAVNVSARFPLLGPSAVTIIDETNDERSVVDGGYFDNSGALTLEQVMTETESAITNEHYDIVPIVIQITSDPDFVWWKDNLRGHLEPGGMKPGGYQFVMPLRTYLSLRGSHGRQAMLGLKMLVEREGRYFHFDQCRKELTEGEAPLAWVISRNAQELLKGLLKSDASAKKGDPKALSCNDNNVHNFERLKQCLEDPGSCRPQP